MKFGFATNCSGQIAEVVREVKRAETLGFDYVWIAEVGLNRDIYVTMTECAKQTGSVLLGTCVTNPYTRHPAITATAFATLDEVSNGRMVIGIGIGSKRNLLEPLGIVRENAGQTCRETVKVMREVLSGDKASFLGQYFKLRDAELGFRPKRVVPIYLAGRGRRTLAVAGEIADGVIFSSLTTPEAIKYAMDAINGGANASGRDPSTLDKALFTRVSLSKDRATAIEAIRPHVPYRIWDDSYETIHQLGYDKNIARRIKSAYDGGDAAQASSLVTDQMIDDFAIAGTVVDCLEKIEKLRQHGVTHVIALPVETRHDSKEQQLRRLSEEIMLRFR